MEKKTAYSFSTYPSVYRKARRKCARLGTSISQVNHENLAKFVEDEPDLPGDADIEGGTGGAYGPSAATNATSPVAGNSELDRTAMAGQQQKEEQEAVMEGTLPIMVTTDKHIGEGDIEPIGEQKYITEVDAELGLPKDQTEEGEGAYDHLGDKTPAELPAFNKEAVLYVDGYLGGDEILVEDQQPLQTALTEEEVTEPPIALPAAKKRKSKPAPVKAVAKGKGKKPAPASKAKTATGRGGPKSRSKKKIVSKK